MRSALVAMLVAVVVISSFGASLAQTVGPLPQAGAPAQQIVGIYAQIVVRDSSGSLVSYLETSRVTVADPARFNQLIDQNMGEFASSMIAVGGQGLQILKANETVVHTYPTIVSQNLISMKTASGIENLVAANHDGYAVLKGDRVTTYWTIIRTAPQGQ